MKLIHMSISSVFIPIYKFPFMYLTLTFSKGALTYSCSEYFVKLSLLIFFFHQKLFTYFPHE